MVYKAAVLVIDAAAFLWNLIVFSSSRQVLQKLTYNIFRQHDIACQVNEGRKPTEL